ncbi:hypothetical protein [Comamonas sp. MYb69]|uniref:hypothetical protein n=1 Tax=Comamonas sp. MYb69 TaxID=1848650 RepID=UPI0030A72B5A
MITDSVSVVVRSADIQIVALSAVKRTTVVAQLREQLGVDVLHPSPWGSRSAPEGCPRADGWELIPQYVGAASCLMFLPGATAIWQFGSGADLLLVLKESSAMEFYVCDDEARYLLCCNDHDFLIGWGIAAPWVASLAQA